MTATEPTEIADAEVLDAEGHEDVHEVTTAALVPVNVQDTALMRPVASLETTVEAFQQYQAMRAELLDPSDFQEAERGKQFVTKSGWRKLAVAMSVSDELVKWEDVEDPFGRIRKSKVTARAIAPNGRYGEGIGICDYRERCCPEFYGEECYKKGSHKHCTPECSGFRHFSKPQHDIPSTAHTRAKNRALSDLFGFGEVSAEEVSGGAKYERDHDEPADGDRVAPITAAMNAIEDAGRRRGLKMAVAQRFGQPHEWMASNLAQIARMVSAAGGKIEEEPDVAARESSQSNDAAPDASAEQGESPPPAEQGPTTSVGGDAEARRSLDTGTPIASPPTSPASDSAPPEGAERPPRGGAGAPVAAAPPSAAPVPSTVAQRRQVGQLERELRSAGKVAEGDKAEIVAILSDDRVTSMADTNQEEATRVQAALKLIEAGEMSMADDPSREGARAFNSHSPRARDFLVKVGLLEPSTP
jgi:hypothetical protein